MCSFSLFCSYISFTYILNRKSETTFLKHLCTYHIRINVINRFVLVLLGFSWAIHISYATLIMSFINLNLFTVLLYCKKTEIKKYMLLLFALSCKMAENLIISIKLLNLAVSPERSNCLICSGATL